MRMTSSDIVSPTKLSDSKVKVLKTKVQLVEAICSLFIMLNESDRVTRICDVALSEFQSALGGIK